MNRLRNRLSESPMITWKHVVHCVVYLVFAVFLYTYSLLVVVHCAEVTSIVLRSLDYTISCVVIMCSSAIENGLLNTTQCAKLNDIINNVQWLYPCDVNEKDPEIIRFRALCTRQWSAHTNGDALMRAVLGALMNLARTILDHKPLLNIQEYTQLVCLLEWHTEKPKKT